MRFYSLTTRLFSLPKWPFYLVCIITLLSLVFTAVMNIINSLIWYGHIDPNLILIGCIDALAVTLFIAPLAIYLIRHSFNLEEMNRNLQQEVAERKRVEAALRESQTRLRSLSDNLPGGLVYQIDSGEDGQERRFAYISAGIELLHGLTAGEALQDPMAIYGQVVEEDRQRIAEEEALALANMIPFITEARLRLPSGEIRWRLFSSAPRRLPNNHLVWDGIEIDITERKRLEEERIVMSKLESTGILAGGIAHDFNNLLAVVLGNLELIKMFGQNGADRRESLRAAITATLEAKNLTQQLITLSSGGNPLTQSTSLARVLPDQISITLSGSPVESELSLLPDLWTVEIDEGQINQVVRNLVLNAREAIPDGGIISIAAANEVVSQSSILSLPPGDYVKISISDPGNGIPEEILPKIFDPYFSTKERGNQKGMGLGLTICRSIVQKHGGVVLVDTKVGSGTTFQVYLPAIREGPPPSPHSFQEILHGSGRILVMDDEGMMRDITKAVLRRLGYEVKLSENGEQVIEYYQDAMDQGRPFDAVLLDLTVRGGMGGKETIQRLLPIDPEVKAVAISGYNHHPVMEHFEQYGFKAALPKPFQIAELAETLTKILGTKKEEQTKPGLTG